MARAWRIEYEGALYHVLSRVDERQAVFLDDEDRGRFWGPEKTKLPVSDAGTRPNSNIQIRYRPLP